MATPPDFTTGQVLTAAQMNAVGLWKITPTSVSGTGASIASNGDVLVSSGATNFTVNGCFSSDYVNYKIIVSELRTSAATGLFVSMGTAKTGSSHKYAALTVTSAGVVSGTGSGGTNAFDLFIVCRSSTDTTGGIIELLQPQLAEETRISCSGMDSDNTGLLREMRGLHTGNTSYTDSFWSVNAAININNIRVSFYGYN